MPKILIIAGDATEDLEFFYSYQRMLEEGYETQVAAPTRKKLRFVVHDFVDDFDTYVEREGHSWPSDLALSEVDPAEYAALVLPGGRAPEYLRNDSDYRRVVTHFFDEDKPVAHICHAAITLAPLGVLKGRRTAAYPACAPDVAMGGGIFVDGSAVVDGKVVSARAWNDQPEWMRAFMEVLREHAPVKG
ncbi:MULTISPECIES: DJ-1/PfpI family protein [Streptomyces]|uniref:DJ-1/PfpI family protein n=1 Tax=Streptomyces decoyicus TaxID=249567 RepID=A0ABZ1FGP8_9ACTN|nr:MULTISPECIES: DJ-1/PfpI family protein [Streptomyces]KOG38482.1 peptidase [Streptomyces decoyicus]MCL7494097.1 DJ-1/PfpI family protein [Streptomyces sp. MCA2]QZY17823.1 DJ-1/PfpI family protein [Streptomyces decoyicus]WSB69351.1 DJ-1/PfpI family protein [Streptomyces decoyicus]WSV47010.1 DJ-1/PfpI family protein [Streptomyces decoyicus]